MIHVRIDRYELRLSVQRLSKEDSLDLNSVAETVLDIVLEFVLDIVRELAVHTVFRIEQKILGKERVLGTG